MPLHLLPISHHPLGEQILSLYPLIFHKYINPKLQCPGICFPDQIVSNHLRFYTTIALSWPAEIYMTTDVYPPYPSATKEVRYRHTLPEVRRSLLPRWKGENPARHAGTFDFRLANVTRRGPGMMIQGLSIYT